MARGYHVWWDRYAMASRGRTSLQEIRDAITAADRLLLLIGPGAVCSDYVRAEWQSALQECKIVVPLLAQGDYELVPDVLSKVHVIDFRRKRRYGEALTELLRVLSEPAPPPATLFDVPALPPMYVPRPIDLSFLDRSLLAGTVDPTELISEKTAVAVHGMGGAGKSVLASAFAQRCDTRRQFVDGVVWLRCGTGGSTMTHGSVLQQALRPGATLPDLSKEEVRRVWLRDCLRGKACLLRSRSGMGEFPRL